MKGVQIVYSAAEMAWLEENRLMVISDYHRVFCATFGRDDVVLVNLHALRKRKGWRTGRTGCFAPGEEPANKGKKCPEGTGGRHPNSRRTQFVKGERRGVAAKLYKSIGSERVTEDGYLERKVHDGLPLQSRWRTVHQINWEAVNGAVPNGYALKCLDGNKRNTEPSNWEAIPRGVLARLNGGCFKNTLAYDDAHPDIKPTVMASAKLKHRVGVARRERKAA